MVRRAEEARVVQEYAGEGEQRHPRETSPTLASREPAHQRRGLGLALITFAEETARASGLAAVRLYTHERMATNIAWYEQLGYVISGTEPIESGRLVHLSKSIAGAC